MPDQFPELRSVVLDTTDARGLAEFYRQLLGYEYRPGDEPPPGADDAPGRDWLVLLDPIGPMILSSGSTCTPIPPGTRSASSSPPTATVTSRCDRGLR